MRFTKGGHVYFHPWKEPYVLKLGKLSKAGRFYYACVLGGHNLITNSAYDIISPRGRVNVNPSDFPSKLEDAIH